MNEIDNLLHQLNDNIKYKGKDADGNVVFEITPGFDVRQCLKRLFDAVAELQKEKKKDGPIDILDKLSSLNVPFHDIKTATIDSNKVELSFFETPVCTLDETAIDPTEFMPADIYKDYAESIKKSVEEDFKKMASDP